MGELKKIRGSMFVAAALLTTLTTACDESVGAGDSSSGAGGTGGSGGEALTIEVPADGRVFVDLSGPALVSPPDEGKADTSWDLAFSGYDVFTNSGASGPGKGGAFGPLAASDFPGGKTPEIPFIFTDETGGAFRNWYAYDGSAHALWSRYHIYGVKSDNHLWKVQILSYYGEVQGAPVGALYRIRYAELSASTAPPKTLEGIDATAGGAAAPADVPSACVDLETGKQLMLTPNEAQQSSAWHLCFRRETISVNGGLSGPRGVTAANLDAAAIASETLEEVQARTADMEEPRFLSMSLAELEKPALAYHGDRILSAFSDQWIEPGSNPPTPRDAIWITQSGDGQPRFLTIFEHFEAQGKGSPGRVTMRVRPAL